MLLLIDADLNPDTGWYGYDYLINQRVVDEKTTTLMRYVPGAPNGPWVEVARLKYRYSGKPLEVAVPRKLLRFEGRRLYFRFPLVRQSDRLKGSDLALHQRRQRARPALQLPLCLEAAGGLIDHFRCSA